MSKRIRWVDYGKGFAIFLVIFGHVALGSLESKNFTGNDALILHYFIEATYAIHIPVFFALSGYFFKPLTHFQTIGQRIYKRIISLGVPYVIFSVIMVLLKLAGGGAVRNQDGLKGLLNIYWQPIDYLWFLYALFFVDIFMSLLSLTVKSRTITVVILIALFIFDSSFHFGIPAIEYICLWTPFYYLGYLLRGIKIPRWLAWWSFILYVIHVPVFCTFCPNQVFLSGYWRIISVFAVVMMFYFFSHHQGFDTRFIEWCGLGSIELYLVHAPVLSVIRIALFKLGVSNLFLQLSVQFAIGVLSSLLVLWFAGRFNFVNFIFRPFPYFNKRSK